MSVHIPPDIAHILEEFWGRKRSERFGDTPPTPEEEIAFIDEFLASGVPTVPLPDGSEVSIASDMGMLGADVAEGDLSSVSVARATESKRQPAWRTIAGVVLVVLALAIIFGPMIKLPKLGGEGNDVEGVEGENGTIELPSGIDSLVASGEVKVPLVVPRTLEILPGDGITSTTFVVVPVQVEEADWPCPVREFDGQPGACWVFGTLVNYLVGIPDTPEARSLVDHLQASGGTMRLRLSTERVLTFQVAEVVDVERHRTEVLAQRHFALTMALLGQEGSSRAVVVAAYDSSTDVGHGAAGSVPQARQPAPELPQTIGLGETVTVGTLDIQPVGSTVVDGETRLTMQVHNRGSLPVAAGTGWQVMAWSQGGAAYEAQIQEATVPPDGSGTVVCMAQEEVSAWRIALGGAEITIII